MQKDTQMDIIADYYMALGDYSPNEKYSESNSRVYTLPESDCWLVLECKGENICHQTPWRNVLKMFHVSNIMILGGLCIWIKKSRPIQ